MKKLISAKTIQQACDSGQMRMEVNLDEFIVTPQAQTLAEQLGVELVEVKNRLKISFTDYQKIVDKVNAHFAGTKFSRAKIEKAVKDVLASGK